MPERIKFIAFGCVHCPLQDPEAVDWVVEAIAREKPDVVVCTGDLHEADAASKWPSEYEWDIKDEWESANAFLGQIYKAYPKAKRYLLEGNHDDNFHGINRIPKKLRRGLDWKEHEPNLQYWERPIGYRNRRSNVLRFGQVSFGHGFECGAASDEFECLKYSEWFGLHIRSHTHRPLQVTRARRNARLPLNHWFANIGCLREMNPDYMARNDVSQWGQAICVGETDMIKSPRSRRYWEARVDIFRMAEDVDWD